ncbi:MAG: B12-binding domain-containing radical SAM protein, partial [Gemmatimonadota bacterium]|nr:B12-binding domain-containing radical SAM protein [Gemmatimonadota bacterium]
MPNALLVYPKNPVTFWSFDEALRLVGKKSAFPPLGLLTIAGMMPDDYSLRV